jgi:hypothetical protein
MTILEKAVRVRSWMDARLSKVGLSTKVLLSLSEEDQRKLMDAVKYKL